jgi:hypothetical protein
VERKSEVMAMVMVEKGKETCGKKMLITVKEMNVLIMMCKSEINVPVSLGFVRLVAAKDLLFQINY